jgi:hypothetical protein
VTLGERLDGHEDRYGMGGMTWRGLGELGQVDGVEGVDDGHADALP